MKVKLIENNKIIEVPHWTYTVIDNEKVILDQEKKIIGIVVEEWLIYFHITLCNIFITYSYYIL